MAEIQASEKAKPTPMLPPIRPVADADGPAVAALIEACFAEYPGCLFAWDEFPELRAPAAWAQGRGTRFWIANDGAGAGRVAGCICATPTAAGEMELHKFYVTAGWRGTGLADTLHGLVLGEASRCGASAIMLWSDTRFTRAHRFYEKRGYVRQPGTRLLGDISDSEEFHYRRESPRA